MHDPKLHTIPSATLETDVQNSYILPLHAIDADMLVHVGGKAANLGVMIRAGLPVPAGFCLTTTAYTRATREAALAPLLEQLALVPTSEQAQLGQLAALIRSQLLAVPFSSDVVEEIAQAYTSLASDQAVPVAVRSSATAEDLPFASFAGQQETYLNVVGLEAILDAVRRCWASLWTDRAVSYRASQAIDQRTVRLAVVIQHMVEAEVAGVLFTANPLTGRRRQAVIDASPGLGEAVVSGAVNPDHFVVNTETGEILERGLGDKRVVIRSTPGGGTQRLAMAEQQQISCLTDEQIQALTQLGRRVEAHYGAPQDIEWALDGNGQLWLTQARPITTLFPLPVGAPITADDMRVYISINVAQGVYRPFTPMGVAAFRLAGSSFAAFVGLPPHDALAGPALFHEAASRMFFDITSVLRHTTGRALVLRALGIMEARSGHIVRRLLSDPRLAPTSHARWPLIRTAVRLLFARGLLLRILQALIWPAAARKRMWRVRERLLKAGQVPANASAEERLLAVERLFLQQIGPSLLGIMPAIMGAGLGLQIVAGKLLGDSATRDDIQTVLRALPYNVTTEMDLALWKLAQQIRADVAASQVLQTLSLEEQVQAYHLKTLPQTLQHGLAQFLQMYGHRAVAEIDMGLPRWSEDPTHILNVLANYLRLEQPDQAPDVQFQRGQQQAEAMVTELTHRMRKRGGWFKSKLVQYCLRQVRALGGLRELPKFYLIQIMALARRLLWPVGEALVQAERLEAAQDIFFLDFTEAHAALAGQDFRAVVHERRMRYEQEMRRRHLPPILLSDGTEPEVEHRVQSGATESTLTGAPASSGVVTAKVRVIMNPVGAHLEPGEILVAPSTDPGWTPLFLTASGLVMEMGGSMSHGSVVAREYGIPAVVGVHGATERLVTGQRITVDGSNGVIVIEPEDDSSRVA